MAEKKVTASVEKETKVTTAAKTADTKKAAATASKVSNTKKQDEVIEKVEEKVADIKKTAKDTAEKTAKTVKKTAKETVKKATAAAKKTTTKAGTAKVYFQYKGSELGQEELLKRIIENWIQETGGKESSIKSFDVYIKPEDDKAYYVINGNIGSVQLF